MDALADGNDAAPKPVIDLLDVPEELIDLEGRSGM
jgi:hypothetical protein